MTLWAGLGGAKSHACVALLTPEDTLGVCEQERITRVRGAGVNQTGLADEALDELLRRSGLSRSDITGYAIAESEGFSAAVRPTVLDHHFAHACCAFLSSPFDSATIIICDHEMPQVTVWTGNGATIAQVDCDWIGPGFSEVYSRCAEALGFAHDGHEQRLEALARVDPSAHDARVESLVALDANRLEFPSGLEASVADWARGGWGESTPLAAALQSHILDLFLKFAADVARRAGGPKHLCVGGSLFSNTSVNSRLKCSGLFEDVFVPPNPGNAGLAIGNALHASGGARRSLSPFLGPSYTSEEIKATLDNCKISYAWASEGDAIGAAVKALARGLLVAWFDGAMEWGPRALGARSILASPFSPYVLENLNRFLKHRDPWRGYAVSVPESKVREYFDGPEKSPFMECDYVPVDRERFRHVLPGPRAAVRVHTVGSDAPPRFRALLDAFGATAGAPVLVNTSFNEFREPIVCSPRDAIRVFFGSGVDLLILGEFIVSK